MSKRNKCFKILVASCAILTILSCNTALLPGENSDMTAIKVDATGEGSDVGEKKDISAEKKTFNPKKMTDVNIDEIVDEDGYVGSVVCKECHEDMYEGWKNTLHSKLVQDAKKNPAMIKGDFSKSVAKKYADVHDVNMTVGSHWMQRYLTKIQDEYYVFPITWVIVTRSWEEQKGSAKRFWKKKKNAYSRKCIGCHTTNYDPEDRSFIEHNVGCEACHGPGYEHIKGGGDDTKIINPAKLDQDRRDMVCAACHVKAEDKTETYAFPIGFRPGEDLADYLSIRTLLRAEGETAETVILREFNKWKSLRDTPRSCDVCGVDKPTQVPVHLIPQAEKSSDFCFGCHDFKEKVFQHTHHDSRVRIKCDDCHKRINGDADQVEKRNIHSYDYYLIHKSGCYDPFIEKSCIKCHKDKELDWATSYVIDWSVPADFATHDK